VGVSAGDPLGSGPVDLVSVVTVASSPGYRFSNSVRRSRTSVPLPGSRRVISTGLALDTQQLPPADAVLIAAHHWDIAVATAAGLTAAFVAPCSHPPAGSRSPTRLPTSACSTARRARRPCVDHRSAQPIRAPQRRIA
jgi:hypothetical protein